MRTWFTSDHHFGHKNIIEYCNRPFKTVEEMDNYMISQWNNAVNSDDIVYHLGDFTLGNKISANYYFGHLKGHIKVLANPWHHDSGWLKGEYYSLNGKVEILPSIVILKSPNIIVLCHYPFAVWDRKHYGSWHLHGHSHGNYTPPKGDLILDVGVDSWEFRPVSIDQIKVVMNIIGEQN